MFWLASENIDRFGLEAMAEDGLVQILVPSVALLR